MAVLDRFKATSILTTIYEYERAAILASDFSTLEKLVPRKEKALQSLAQESSNTFDIEQLKLLAERNQRLLSAAANGINSVRQRLDALTKVRDDFQTYGPQGQTHEMALKPLTMK